MPRIDKTQIAWLRDIDTTGSLHVCAKGDPGATPFIPCLPLVRVLKQMQRRSETPGEGDTFEDLARDLRYIRADVDSLLKAMGDPS
jgi:hypothetical protein